MNFVHLAPQTRIPKLKKIDSPSGRTYVDPDGNSYTSVTSFLGSANKEFHIEWSKSHPGESEIACDRGTEVHHIIECYLNNTPEEEIDFSVVRGLPLWAKKNKGTLDQFKPGLAKIQNISSLEVQMCSKMLQLAGTADCIAMYNGVKSVIDFKTSKRSKDIIYIGDYFLQSTCYAIMWEELTGEVIPQIVIMIAGDDDSFDVHVEHPNKNVKNLYKRLKEFQLNRINATV